MTAIDNFLDWERQPNRQLTILNPDMYNGQLSSQGTYDLGQKDQAVFVVNGYLQKVDHSF